MSYHPQPITPIPDETSRVARAAFPKGTLAMDLRDELAGLYTDQDFADLFAARGQVAECPWRLAVVTVLQFLEGLTDRQAADAVRSRIDWKYLLGLDLTDTGFHFTVLHAFRVRLLAGQAEQRLLTIMLERLQGAGLLKARGRQRTDSTHVLAAVRTMNRLEIVGETLRCALNRLAALAPDWLRAQVTPDWFARYGVRVENYRLPKADTERAALAATIGADGFHLLQAALDPHAPEAVRTAPAIEILRQVWVQQYYGPEAPVRWRTGNDVPPAECLIHSPYDIEARYSIKRGQPWLGYKVHLTETCDDDTPHLITQVETTPATVQDDAVTARLQDDLAARGLAPAAHFVDAGYTTAGHLVTSRAEHGIDLVGPVAASAGWQARAGTGFALDHFAIDWDARTVTCPQGKRSRSWEAGEAPTGRAQIKVRFHAGDCRACACRVACTRRKTEPRALTILPQAEYEALRAARQRQDTPAFQEAYACRAGVEGTLAQGVRVGDLRHSRYIGLARTHLQQIITAVALNILHTLAWLHEVPRAPTRVSRFAALAS
ncbi:MAG TPA: IS1182 family transposase [Herpetosiphonaceae bacterium]|nr:IS1182 family transposase [Herpetosiphonaceae bacterium]